MPSPGTPRVSVRVPPELWQAAQVKAQEKGTNVSAEIVRFLERWVRSTSR